MQQPLLLRSGARLSAPKIRVKQFSQSIAALVLFRSHLLGVKEVRLIKVDDSDPVTAILALDADMPPFEVAVDYADGENVVDGCDDRRAAVSCCERQTKLTEYPDPRTPHASARAPHPLAASRTPPHRAWPTRQIRAERTGLEALRGGR